jgi:hypothetical protein
MQARARFIDLVKGFDDPVEKVRTLYNYMQQRTRYVSIQVGIGGWQPFLASVVDEKGYGDCKALAHYMKSILDAVGIRSVYTLVMNKGIFPASELPAFKEFLEKVEKQDGMKCSLKKNE